jgi:hypothetical protein
VVFEDVGHFHLWGLIWGTVYIVLGSFLGLFWDFLGPFYFMGVDLGYCVSGFRWFLGS